MVQIKETFKELTREDVDNYRKLQKNGEELYVLLVTKMDDENMTLQLEKMPELNVSVDSYFIQEVVEKELDSIFPILATKEMIEAVN